jgi:hypothetical protein
MLDVEDAANDLRAAEPGGKGKNPGKEHTAMQQSCASRSDGKGGEAEQFW